MRELSIALTLLEDISRDAFKVHLPFRDLGYVDPETKQQEYCIAISQNPQGERRLVNLLVIF